MGGTFVGSAAALIQVATHGPIVLRFYDPVAIAQLVMPIGFQVDRLAAVMMVLVSGVGTLIFRYSIRYMIQEAGYGRFLALVGITTSVLLAMVASSNLVMLFVCWQLLSYLLYQLAHNLGHAATRDGAIRTFRLLRAGDAVFLAGILLARCLYGTTEFSDLFARAISHPVVLSPLPGLHISGATVVALLVFLGAMGKSAQVPMHVWLPRSLYAPTPVHALLHAGIINACGFLINRLAPLYGESPATLHVVFAVGAVTAILGATMMLIQNDIKRSLGFSTIGQMGYMVMECGLGAYSLAVFHLVAHGLFKAYVFLACGNGIHYARQEPALPVGTADRGKTELRPLVWATGLFMTLLMPLGLLVAVHGAAGLPPLASQGTIIFLLFSWVASTQAMFTLVRLRTATSWKGEIAMLLALPAVLFTYLVAAARFDTFLYPDSRVSAAYMEAARLPAPLFDGLIVVATVVFVMSWTHRFAALRGGALRTPQAIRTLFERFYVLLMNQMYLDRLVGAMVRWRQPLRVSRTPHPATAGLALVIHAAAGVIPFAIAAAALGTTLGLTQNHALGVFALAALWFVGSWMLFDLTHEAMYGT